jgi:AAA-like domain
MAKSFNITGLCSPKKHYMADVSAQLGTTLSMVERGDYFIINRPRQYGKTTMLYTIAAALRAKGDYVVFNISFEGIGDVIFDTEASFSKGFLEILAEYAQYQLVELEPWLRKASMEVKDLKDLSSAISSLMLQTDKKVVILIDEVDRSSNNQLFVLFLAMLRNKFLQQEDKPTFHSVILAGLHDVKTLKLKLRPDEAKTYNSPWNIATAYKVNMNLLPQEIKPMLEDYAQEQGVTMDTQLIADRLFYLTSGYPYLVSHLCKIIVEDIMPAKTEKEWAEADVNKAFHLILREPNNANFDTLVKNLKEYPDLRSLVYGIVIDGQIFPYENYDSTVNLGILHGIFGRSETGNLIIQNRIYRELIANTLISEWRTSHVPKQETSGFGLINQYLMPNNGLDMQKVLENFQAFMKKEYSSKDRIFLERDGRMVFLAFMRPILNGAGYDFKEPQVSDEKRLDVIITYYQHLYVAELKIWHGAEAHKKGLAQLVDYLDTLGLETGFLLIFDHNKKKTWEKDWITVDGKRIFYAKV